MSAPEDDRRETPTSWGDQSSEETQVVRPPVGGYDRPTEVAGPSPASSPPVGSPIGESETQVVEPVSGNDPAWNSSHTPTAPEHAPANDYPSQAPMTSVYPPSTPGYAPSGYPPAYASQPQAATPVAQAIPAAPPSRVLPGFLSALIGLILTAGGLYLAVKYGAAAANDLALTFKIGVKHTILAVMGAVLLFVAVLLNGWSPWATLIPGIALTGLGGWAMFSLSAQRHIGDWVKSVLAPNQLAPWLLLGFILILGLTMFGSSIAAMMARAAGKKAGTVVGFNRARV